jgi:predicted house-cleaning noncanonical NTP pyrophosphatase (MazG superfamily)
MIKLNPLYLLLLIELSVILGGGLVVFLLKSRKYISLYREALKDLVGAKQAQEDLRKRLAMARDSVPDIAHKTEQIQEHKGAQEADELEGLRTKLHSVEEELKEKNHKMEQLQLKFADLEKEYMVLYQQQQSQQQQPDIP